MLTDSALSYSSISVSLCWKTERFRFLTEFLSLLWMAEHRYLNLSNITPCARYFGARQYLRSCWGHGRVSSLPELLLSRPDHSVCTTVEPEKTQRQTAEEMNSKWNFTASIKTFHYVLQAPLSFPVLMVHLRDRIILPETSWRISQSTSTTPIKCTIKLSASDYLEATGLYSFPGGNPSELIYFLDHSREKHN